MPLPTLPPIDTEDYARYRTTQLRRASSRALLERARAIPPPAYRGLPEIAPPPPAVGAPAPAHVHAEENQIEATGIPAQGENGWVFPVADYGGKVELHWGKHPGGADLFAPPGTPVRAAVGGRVLAASFEPTGGNNVIVQGDDGQQYYYAHLQDTPAVARGQQIAAGTVLGGVGDTGNAKGTGAHLHFGAGKKISTGTGPAGGTGTDFDAVGALRTALTPAAGAATPPSGIAAPAAPGAPDEIEVYVRDAAARRGIDPDVAVRAANTEGGLREPARRGTFKTGSCYDSTTRVLTRRGFIHFADTTMEDEFATRRADGFIEYQRPLALQRTDYSGPMYRVRNRNVDLLITPNHRMLAYRHMRMLYHRRAPLQGRKPRAKNRITGYLTEPELEFIEIQNMRQRHWRIPAHAFWAGELREEGERVAACDPADFAAFAGLYLAEGHVQQRRRFALTVTQKRGITLAPVQRLLAPVGDWQERGPDKADRYHYRLASRPLALWARPLGKSAEKYVPRDLLHAPPAELLALFTGLWLGDGAKARGRYGTNSPQLAEDVAELAIKLGFAASILTELRATRSRKDGQPYHPIHIVSVRPGTDFELDMTRHVSRVEDWSGEVFCATVPNHTLLVERNGKITWCSNSWWPFQLHYGGKGYESLGTTAGMGNSFTQQTGWEPGDPAAWRASVDYALDGVAKNGWGAWYGPAKIGITGRAGIAKDAQALGVDPANLPGAPPAMPAAAAALPAPEVAAIQQPPRTYASPREQLADLATRYGQGAPAGDFAASAEAQLADLGARYGLPAMAPRRAIAATAPRGAVPDYQALANAQLAETQRARAQRTAALAPPPVVEPEPVYTPEPLPPEPTVEGIPLSRLEAYDQPTAVTGPPPGFGLTGDADRGIGLGPPPPEPLPAPVEPPVVAPEPIPLPPPVPIAPPPEPANPFERVGRALVDALQGVPEMAAPVGGGLATAGQALGPVSPGEVAGAVGRITETPREIAGQIAGTALDVARAVTPTSIAARTLAGEEQIATESRPEYEALLAAMRDYGPDSNEAYQAQETYNAKAAALRTEGVYAAAERNRSLMPAELTAGLAGSLAAGVVAPTATAGVARNVAATVLDPTQGLFNVAGPAARAVGRVPRALEAIAPAAPPVAPTREAFEETVAPLVRGPETAVHGYTIPAPEIPIPTIRPPRPTPVPPSLSPGTSGATALDTILPPPAGEPALGGADRLKSALATFTRELFDDRIDLKLAQRQVEQAYGGELPASLRAVELDRLTNGTDMTARLRIERELEPRLARAGTDLPAVKAGMELLDNLDKAAAIGAREGTDIGEARKFSRGLNAASSRAALADLEARLGPERWARTQDAMNGVSDYVGGLRERLVEAGVWSREFADDLSRQFPHYVPTRILDYMDEAGPRFGGGQKLGISDPGLKHLTVAGTEREREDLIASLARMAFEVERRARKNEAARAVYAWREIDPELASLMREVKPGAKHTKDEVPLYFFENGAKREVLVDRVLEPVISFQSVGGKNLAERLGAFPAQVVRETATSRNPLFALAGNPLLDLPTYLFRESAQYGVQRLPRIALELAKGYGDAFAGLSTGQIRGRGLQRFLAGGGGQFGYFGGSQKEAAELAGGIERRALGRVVNSRNDAMSVLQDVASFGWVPKVGYRAENAPRVAAMRLAERYGADPQAAIMAGRTVTQDFTQGGLFTKAMNQYIPFFNIAMQSPYWLAQTARKNPKGAIAAVTSIAIAPAVTAEAWNRSDPERAKAYDDIPDFVKNRGVAFIAPPQLGGPWLPPDKDGRVRPNYLFIPMRNLAPFTILAREAAGRAMGDASPQDWYSVLLGLVGASSPISTESAEGAFSSLVPAIFGPGIQLAFNRDIFRQRAIVSDVADEQATLGSHRIAEGLQKVGLKDVRPSAVEFVLREAGNGIAGMGLAAVDLGEKIRTGEPITGPNPALRDLPAVGGLISRFLPAYGGQRDADLRTLRDETRDALLAERRRQIPGYEQLPDKAREQIEGDASATATALVYGTDRQPNTIIRNLRDALKAAGHDPAEISRQLAELRKQLRGAAEQVEPTRRAVVGAARQSGGA